MAFDLQANAQDTLASALAAGATTGTLASGNFTNFTDDYLVVDPGNTSKLEIIKCTVSGTGISSITRGQAGTSDQDHDAGAVVKYAFVPAHYEALTTNVGATGGDGLNFVLHSTNGTADFSEADLTTDGTNNTLDISSVVPATCVAASITLIVKDDAVNSNVYLRSTTDSNNYRMLVRTATANEFYAGSGIVPVNSQSIAYRGDNTTFTNINIIINGWWETV